jgi:PIN domain nuclease of toxin-antitoxin system
VAVLLDTHVWLWWLTPGSPLPRRERDALDAEAAGGALAIAAISLWEAQVLQARGRLQLPLPFADWITRATDSRMLSVVPLDRDVVIGLDALPAGFHGDPADRLIVATARTHAMSLATHDAAIRRSRAARLWRPA